MNKLSLIIIINSLILSSTGVIAENNEIDPFENFGGYVGEKRSEIILTDWICEYCAEVKEWEFQLDAHVGTADNNPYHGRNYSDLPHTSQLFFSGKANMQQEDGRYWKNSFQNLGLDSGALQSAYGKKGFYDLKIDYQRIPVRKFDQLSTPFANPGSNNLALNNNWIQSDNGTLFTDPAQYSSFKLGTDWDRFGLNFTLTGDNNFDFKTSYQRLEKEGIREMSVTQMLSATYLPFPLHQITEDFSASLDYFADLWYASFAVKVSKFNNAINSVTYNSPFSPLVVGSEFGTVSTAPDNLATTFIFNGRYYYAKNSSAKVRYSQAVLTQDDAFLPYTTNLNLLTNLPQDNLDGKVVTQDLTIQLHHWINSDWSIRAKYRNRERDNETDQLLFQPVVTDVYIASELMNLPYDYSKESFNGQVDYRPFRNQLLSLSFKSDKKTRNFQSVSETTVEGYTAKYRATLFDNLVVMLKVEEMDREGTELQLVDYFNVEENPLMQRYNVADRQQDKVDFQLYYSPLDNFSVGLSGMYAEQFYANSSIGLSNNVQENLNVNFNWQISKTINTSVYLQDEEIETDLAGSNTFSTPNWYANNIDEATSYGFNLSIIELLDGKLAVLFDYNRSDADTVITMTSYGVEDLLPEINSLWSQAELKAKYLYSDELNFAISYQYHKFESNDFAIDGVVPGSLTNLITYGALSNNYDFNFLLFTVSYTF